MDHYTLSAELVTNYLNSERLMQEDENNRGKTQVSHFEEFLPLKQVAPVLRSIQCWSDQPNSTLQDCFGHVNWDMFRVASDNNIDGYADSVSEFIRKYIRDVGHTVTIKTYPNQKLWMDGSIRTKLKAQTTTFNHEKRSGNMAEYKQCSYSLGKAIKQAKCRDKVESQLNVSDTRRM